MEYRHEEILIAVAHPSEEEAVRASLSLAGYDIEILVTGVGGPAVSWALQKRFSSGLAPSLVIGAGIAGTYITELFPGDTVLIRSDCFADMGIDDNGNFRSLFSARLADPDKYPFSGGKIFCKGKLFEFLALNYPTIRGATVNMASGSYDVIERIRKAWNPDVETMEGAWLAYICAVSHIEWLSVRTISNRVEPRDPQKWDIPLALSRLGEAMKDIIQIILKQ